MRSLTITVSALLLLLSFTVKAQTAGDILSLLTKKGTITQGEADSIRREYNARQSRYEASEDSFPLRIGRSLGLSGYTQVIYQNFAHQVSGKYYDGFTIKRARLDFQGHFATQWDYRLLIDFVGNSGASGTAPTGGSLLSPTPLDASITYKPFDFLNIKAGQMLIDFSLESLTQDRYLDMIERSQVVNALVARKGDAVNGLVDSIGNQQGRDLGFQVNGSLFRSQGFYMLDYYFQVLDGAGINTLDNNPSKDIDYRVVIHPLKELSLGSSVYVGNDRFTSSPTKDQRRFREGYDLALVYPNFSIKGEYIWGQDGNSNPASHLPNNGLTTHEGWYGQVAYFFIPKVLQAVFRYDWYDPYTEKKNVTGTYYDFGLNYFFNVWTKATVYYSLRNQQGATFNPNLFEAQLQLGF
jgi:phosphate-selective porin OprO and OprP